ncbi:MAG TPA: VWA domain-containing protein [Thermoanaerobaculia bacterium]
MRKPLILFFAVAAATPLFAQSLTEKIDVSLVNVDVTVTSHGAPARGLTRDDFEVLEDGVPQNVTHFYAIENAREKTAAEQPAVAGTPAAAQPSPRDERFRRKVLVIIDNRHMSIHNRDVALRNLEKFINERFNTGSYDFSIAMIGDGAHLLLPLTSDKERIHGALAQIRDVVAGRAMRDIYKMENRTARIMEGVEGASTRINSVGARSNTSLESLVEQSNRMQSSMDAQTTYEGILEIARSFANTSGRKIMLLMTGGFGYDEDPLRSADPSLATQQNAGQTTLRTLLVREANASDVSISVIDTEGLTPSNFGADVMTNDLPQIGFGGQTYGSMNAASSPANFYWVAQETGGQNFTGNFVDKSLRDFDLASSNFYSLAYTPGHHDDGKYHTITVRLKKPGPYKLSYRSGYSSLPLEEQIDRAMHSAMAVDMQPSSIPVNLTTGAVKPGDAAGSVLVPVFAQVSAKELQFVPSNDGSVARVDFFLSVFTESGRLVRTFRAVREARAKSGTENDGNFIESHALRLKKGAPYRVVVAVHDQVSDAVGIRSTTVRF